MIGWLRQSCVTLKGACASLRCKEGGWSWSVCAGKDVFVSCEEGQNESVGVCLLAVGDVLP